MQYTPAMVTITTAIACESNFREAADLVLEDAAVVVEVAAVIADLQLDDRNFAF